MSAIRHLRIGGVLSVVFAGAAAMVSPAAAAVADEGRSWIEGDRYHEVVVEEILPGRPADGTVPERRVWSAKCPADYPFLDGSVVNEFETGRGFIVKAPYRLVWLGEASDGGLRDWIRIGDGSWRTGGTSGHLENRSTAPVSVYLEMVCSADERDGWKP